MSNAVLLVRRAALVLAPLLVVASSSTPPVKAQPAAGPGPLTPDRPTVSASAWIVPPGHMQVEIGITHTQSEFDGLDLGVTESLVTSARFGWRPWIELQLNYLGVIDVTRDLTLDGGREIRQEFNGSSDFDVASKLALWVSEDGRWGATALVGLTLPTGEEGFGTEGFDPRGTLALSGVLSDRLGIDLNLGVDTFTYDTAVGEDTAVSLIGAVALGWALNERSGVTVEFSSVSDAEGEGPPSNTVLAALGVRFRDNLQLDLFGGGGVNDANFDWIAGGGLSVRLPE